jgi:hypothetical protein
MSVQAPQWRPHRVLSRPNGPVEPLNDRLLGIAAVGAGGVGLAAAYQLSGGRIGIPCLLKQTTGLSCPLCGTTRMAAAMLRGDLGAAWSFNAPMTVIGPLVAVAVGYQLLAWALERFRIVKAPRLRLSSRAENTLTLGFGILMIVFGVLRNVL